MDISSGLSMLELHEEHAARVVISILDPERRQTVGVPARVSVGITLMTSGC